MDKAIRPMRDLVLIRRDKRQGKVGSFELPTAYREQSDRGTVLATGPKCKEIKDGDRVFWDIYNKAGIRLDEEHLFIREKDLFILNEG